MISDDLVNSYHLLLCALDLVFSNALLCNTRKELLNPNFKGDLLAQTYIPSLSSQLSPPMHTVHSESIPTP